MKYYILLFRGGESGMLQHTPETCRQHMSRWMQWMSSLSERGLLDSAQPINSTGKLITGIDKKVTDGPFGEGNDMVGGYLLCHAENYEAAVEIGCGCPVLEFGTGKVEIREIREMQI